MKRRILGYRQIYRMEDAIFIYMHADDETNGANLAHLN